jgi:hypothetical protein
MGERLKYVPLSFHLSPWTSTEKLIACGIEKYYKETKLTQHAKKVRLFKIQVKTT